MLSLNVGAESRIRFQCPGKTGGPQRSLRCHQPYPLNGTRVPVMPSWRMNIRTYTACPARKPLMLARI